MAGITRRLQVHYRADTTQPGGGPQELLRLGQRVERPPGGDAVQCDPNRLALGSQSPPLAARLPPSLCGPWRSEPDRPQRIAALADDTRAPRRVGSTGAGAVAPLGQSRPPARSIGSSRHLLTPASLERLTQPQTDDSMAMPRYRPTGARSARLPDRIGIRIKRWRSRLPKHSDTMMTRCAPANFLGWVIGSGTLDWRKAFDINDWPLT